MKVVRSLLLAYLLTGLLAGITICIGSLSGSLPLHTWDTSASNPGFWVYPIMVVYAMMFWGPAVVRSLLALSGVITGVEVKPLYCIILIAVFLLFFLFFMRKKQKKTE